MKTASSKKVIMVGVSGGVDSSVTLATLKKQGYTVIGVFLRTWQPDWVECTWRDERRDAMRVCAHLDVPFIEVNAEESYKKGVADYMIHEYKKGRTPNPDVFCNKEVKFGHFLEWAKKHGADGIATGHYARCLYNTQTQEYELHEAIDEEKDQSYFLWTLTQDQLRHSFFPLGEFVKKTTRKLAHTYRLPTATKKDSQGVCFLGPIDMKAFLMHEIETMPGAVVTRDGTEIGAHKGALLYTLGERHGFGIHQHVERSSPYYVVGKDIIKNHLIVDTSITPTQENTIYTITDVHISSGSCVKGDVYAMRYRYHGERVPVTIISFDPRTKEAQIQLDVPHLIASGQSAVLYDGTRVVGGGIFA